MPQAEVAQSPTTAAMRHGINASYRMRPIASTSTAKMAPASGVPKTAPKPAATPAMSNVRMS